MGNLSFKNEPINEDDDLITTLKNYFSDEKNYKIPISTNLNKAIKFNLDLN